MICTCIRNKSYADIVGILQTVEMAEVRLDGRVLSDEEITDIFQNSEIPLIATCRYMDVWKANPEMKPWEAQVEAERRLNLAVDAGARYADMELEQNATISKRFQQRCHRNGVEIIRSFHDFEKTPDSAVLAQALDRCFRYGAEIAKIVTLCSSAEDWERLKSLYGRLDRPGSLVAFGMGETASSSRLECLKLGAPFTYAALTPEDATASGQLPADRLSRILYGNRPAFNRSGLRMPSSKSFAQRAIIAAALSEGTSRLGGYTACADSEAAIAVARALGAEVSVNGGELTVRGAGPIRGRLPLERIDVGESGLLARLMIPLAAALCEGDCVVSGGGTLLSRPLKGASDIMAAFGVILSPESGRDLRIPVKVHGTLIPGTADIDGSTGSQLISGLLMALPLCGKDSTLYVSDPKSIPYLYITLDVLRRFGVSTRSEMEGNAEMLEQQDWSYCTGINFRIRGGSGYRAADFDIEGDWSSAAAFLVAGAVFGSVRIDGLDEKSLQADISILDILVDAGAVVSIDEQGGVCVRKAPLEGFSADLNNAPDLFPVTSVLAAMSEGESRLIGVGRLSGKESDRAGGIVAMLTQMGVPVVVEGDDMVIRGESLTRRLACGHLLNGGRYTSSHDHRMVMALKVAEMAASSAIEIDDRACVAKSFPDFLKMI